MKRICLFMLLMPLMPLTLQGSEDDKCKEKIDNLLNTRPVNWLGALSLQHSKLTNKDLNIVLKEARLVHHLDVSHNNISDGDFTDLPASTKLLSFNLSDNDINGKLDFARILINCPRLETVKLNNNKITAIRSGDCFAGMKANCAGEKTISVCTPHTNLKTLELRNTDITNFRVGLAYDALVALETIDLSDSKNLTILNMNEVIGRNTKDNQPRVMRILLNGVVIPETDLEGYRAQGMVDTDKARWTKWGGCLGLFATGAIGFGLMVQYHPTILLSYPIPVQSIAPAVAQVTNMCMHSMFDIVILPLTPVAITSLIRRWKPDFGKRAAIEFVTNNGVYDAV